MAIQLGQFSFNTPIILAPMAGVTDKPFRQLCRRLGADLAVSEMVKAHQQSNKPLAGSVRGDTLGEASPRSVQIIGNEPRQMAETARMNVEHGADIIDINMGCPAKKFARKPAGSALLAYPQAVACILNAVTRAVNVPVTLKIRTGVDAENINALEIGRIAEQAGIRALTVHGRTRAQKFTGQAEHQTTRMLVEALSIPVFANGDIESPDTAEAVLKQTGAAGLVIGRSARKNPWIFSQIKHRLRTGESPPSPDPKQVQAELERYLECLHDYYGEERAVQMAGKHLGWCVNGLSGASRLRHDLRNSLTVEEQYERLKLFFEQR